MPTQEYITLSAEYKLKFCHYFATLHKLNIFTARRGYTCYAMLSVRLSVIR